jgi:hypothetical protein
MHGPPGGTTHDMPSCAAPSTSAKGSARSRVHTATARMLRARAKIATLHYLAVLDFWLDLLYKKPIYENSCMLYLASMHNAYGMVRLTVGTWTLCKSI